MTDPAAPASTPETQTACPAADGAPAPAPEVSPAGQARPERTGRRGPRSPAGGEKPAVDAPQRRAPRPVPPALEQLAALYPPLFGAVFRPLKRGIFQDLMAAHPEAFEKDALKQALAIHTRSTRYLQAVAAGQQRHDLQGQPVEAMAPEHVHHALVEVYKRRQGRGQDDLLPRLRARI
ncbi:MAG: ProQ/FINO family protein, partial [Giesbergeria sp.]